LASTLWGIRSPRPALLLDQCRFHLSQALSDITGLTGLRIIRAIVAGERDPQHLAALRNDRCRKEADEIALALTGTWREENLFVLTQALALFDFYTTQLSACDAQIERAFSVITPRFETAGKVLTPAPLSTPPRRKPHSHSQNGPQGNTRVHLFARPSKSIR
jgi:hypothetical protein